MAHMNILNNKGELEGSIKDGCKVVMFCASWCPPCQNLSRTVQDMEEYTGVQFCKIDADENPDVAQEYEIKSYPTTIFFCCGKKIEQMVGFSGEQALHKFIVDNKEKAVSSACCKADNSCKS